MNAPHLRGSVGQEGDTVKRLIEFIRSRPTETWLGLWVAVVAALEGFGISLDPKAVAGVGGLIAWGVTALASHTGGWGPTDQ